MTAVSERKRKQAAFCRKAMRLPNYLEILLLLAMTKHILNGILLNLPAVALLNRCAHIYGIDFVILLSGFISPVSC